MKPLTVTILALLALASRAQDNHIADSVDCIFVTDPMPLYPGGVEALKSFIKENLKSPGGREDVLGVVYVAFVVKEDGQAVNFEIMRGLCDPCDKNAIEILQKMPKWVPAQREGKPIRVRMVVPVRYD